MNARTLVFILLILVMVGCLPSWPYMRERQWGWYPSTGALGILLLLLILMALGII